MQRGGTGEPRLVRCTPAVEELVEETGEGQRDGKGGVEETV